MNNQKPTPEEIATGANVASLLTVQTFARYEGRGLLTQDRKRAKISRTTLAEVTMNAFLHGLNHGKSMKGVAP